MPQEQVDEIIGRRVAEAQRQATRKLVEDLGFTKVEEAKAALEAAKATERAQMTEAQRLQAEATDAKRAADLERASLAAERHSLSVERVLTNARAQGNPAGLVALVKAEVGADQAAIEAAVAQLKQDYPSLFGVSTLPSSEPAGGGAPPGRTTASNQDPLAAGAAKAEAYEKRHQRTGFS